MNRLTDYISKKEISEKVLRDKHADKECTFAPKINKQNTRNLDLSVNKSQEQKPSQYNSRTERNVKRFENKQKKNKSKLKSDQECTFAPKIDLRSVQILEKKERDQEAVNTSVFNRLRKCRL